MDSQASTITTRIAIDGHALARAVAEQTGHRPPTAGDLRAAADDLDACERADRKAAKRRERAKRRMAKDRDTVRRQLLAVLEDPTKGYAKVEAARALRELDLI